MAMDNWRIQTFLTRRFQSIQVRFIQAACGLLGGNEKPSPNVWAIKFIKASLMKKQILSIQFDLF
jgi:hypothetical protein